jgi:triphosphoribosyl-dephospho-CoA synthase
VKPACDAVCRAAIARARAAFLWACRLDVEVRKPGNVSVASAGHRMDAPLFIASAEAAQHALFEPGLAVGRRIEAAAAATREVAHCNTNLGILLLCAPIAVALEREPQAHTAATLRAAVSAVLQALSVDDAAAAYRAIAMANPGGLGRADAQDVAQTPSIDLRSAMTLAAHRDSIARQYAEHCADLFDTGLAAFLAAPTQTAAVQRTYLSFLAHWPDSHIVRKLGEPTAHSVMRQARDWLDRAARGESLDDCEAFVAWDSELKTRGINPGTSADLTVATAMLAAIVQPHRLASSSRGTERDNPVIGASVRAPFPTVLPL